MAQEDDLSSLGRSFSCAAPSPSHSDPALVGCGSEEQSVTHTERAAPERWTGFLGRMPQGGASGLLVGHRGYR